MSTLAEAQKRLGELFLIGFEGKTLADDTAAFLSQARIGGVILFTKNYENPKQVQELINQVQECRVDERLWIAVDQEGGRVQRFKAPFTIIPPAATIASKASPKAAFDLSQLMAKELKAVGVNLNFVPVADILTNPTNQVIGDRAYGTDEDTVTKYVTAMVRGHVTNAVQACVKHFPGHGGTVEDSHFDLPKINIPLATLQEREFRPFMRAFKSRCSMVMTAHILNEALDPKYPATLSKRTLIEILRNEIRFSKVVFSDDLEMQAITDHYGAEEAPVMALEASCDILIYRTEKAARHAYEAVYKALESGRLSPERILEAAERSIGVKKETFEAYKPGHPDDLKTIGSPEHKAFIDQILQA